MVKKNETNKANVWKFISRTERTYSEIAQNDVFFVQCPFDDIPVIEYVYLVGCVSMP